MLEVGIAALERVLDAERAGATIPEARITDTAVGETGD